MPTNVSLLCLALTVLPVVISAQTTTPPSARPGASIPPDCNKPELLAKGQPVMTHWRDGLAFGFSLPKHDFKVGEPIVLAIWVDNPSDSPAGVMTCSDLGYIEEKRIGIYDASGRRILDRFETRIQEKCKTRPLVAEAMSQWRCLGNITIHVAAHTCVNGDSPDFTSMLTVERDLPPGDYTVRARSDNARTAMGVCKPEDKAPVPPEPGTAVSFSVVKP